MRLRRSSWVYVLVTALSVFAYFVGPISEMPQDEFAMVCVLSWLVNMGLAWVFLYTMRRGGGWTAYHSVSLWCLLVYRFGPRTDPEAALLANAIIWIGMMGAVWLYKRSSIRKPHRPPSPFPPIGFKPDIECVCHICGSDLRVPAKYAGITGRCNHCGGRITVPNIAPPSAV
jgi:DNA-directed RNA polymerase subunit RPC12/RpoP